MCIFSGDIKEVSDTSIFARRASDGGQYLVYSMHYEASRRLAMILPLPTPKAAPEDAVRFLDLSRYPEFFSDMATGFPEPQVVAAGFLESAVAKPLLKVHEVGSFEASFVPSLRDFDHLDPRFRLPPLLWSRLPQYSDYGFAIFKLQAGEYRAHPMAFHFQSRSSERLFFPTVHVHDGEARPKAHFSHTLYCQASRATSRWQASSAAPPISEPEAEEVLAAGEFMDVERALGIVVPAQPVLMKTLYGLRRNADVWVSG